MLDTGHFAWEDGADEWGDIALDWIQGGYKRSRCSSGRGCCVLGEIGLGRCLQAGRRPLDGALVEQIRKRVGDRRGVGR